MTLEELLTNYAGDDADVPMLRAALALAPGRLASGGLFPDEPEDTGHEHIHDLAVRFTTLLEHQKALEALGDDKLDGWALANAYGSAAYAMGIAMGYMLAFGLRGPR